MKIYQIPAKHAAINTNVLPRLWPIVIYNIAYRTSVNLGNAAMLELAGRANIVGVKDCSADMAQSFDLLHRKPSGFAVLAGEDVFYHPC